MLIRYLYFWFYSSNQHGVHSPFVFDLVSHCFFNKDWKKIKFFPFTNDQFKSLDRQFQERLKNYFSHKVSTTQTLYTLKFVTKDTDVKQLSAESNCIWVFSGLHSDRSQWVQVSKTATIRIDCFFWGILSFKKDQATESFYLRIV